MKWSLCSEKFETFEIWAMFTLEGPHIVVSRTDAQNGLDFHLSNRHQFVQIDNEKSSFLTMTCGVPQGSTLGPLLFLIYINDMVNSSSILSFRMFADDANIFYSDKDPKKLELVMNTELKKVLDYCSINKLSVNMKKTNFMVISSNTKEHININIYNIERKSCIKYLGIYLDEHLNWKSQIVHVNNKIAKNIGIFYTLRFIISIYICLNSSTITSFILI
jgi:hypothetical protein